MRVGLGYVHVGRRGRSAAAIAGGQPYRDVGDLARRVDVKQDALEALVAAGACDEWGPRRELLWRLGVTARGEAVGGGNRQLALPLEPTAEIPQLPAQTPWERMLADYKHTSLSVGVHPLELLRPHLPAASRRAPSWHETPNGARDRGRGHGDRAPAAGDRERDRLHAARGRARPGEPDHPAEGLRGAPRDRPRRAAAARARHASSVTTATSTCSSRASSRSARSPAGPRARPR